MYASSAGGFGFRAMPCTLTAQLYIMKMAVSSKNFE